MFVTTTVAFYAVFIENDEIPNQLSISSEKLDKLWYNFKPCEICQHEKVNFW